MIFCCVLVSVIGASLALPSAGLLGAHWTSFKLAHERLYESHSEEAHRLTIFAKNFADIENHNEKFRMGLVTYAKAINQFGDMTQDEFLAYVNKHKYVKMYGKSNTQFDPQTNAELPSEWDWRDHNVVTGVKNQLSCGSCWAFSTTGALEGQNAIINKHLVSLSEQNLIDCSYGFGNYGCHGGFMDNALRYAIEYGIESERDYPYEDKVGKCRNNSTRIVLKPADLVDIEVGNEEHLKEAVASKGPVSIAIVATPEFQFYAFGYFNDHRCVHYGLNHGVLVVGYGSEHAGDYWIVKNSWGPNWGEKGYIRMARNKQNRCGVASLASYPVLPN